MAAKAASYLSKELGTRVQVGGLDISWFMDIVLERVVVEDKSGKDILNADRIRFDIGKLDRKNRYIGIYAIGLTRAEINLKLNATDSLMNYGFIIDYFSGTDSTGKEVESEPWKIGISGIGMKDCSFNYSDERKPHSENGIDYDYLSISGLNLDIRRLVFEGDSIKGNIIFLSLREKSGFVLNEFSAECLIKPEKIVAKNLHIETPQSNINLNLTFSHNSFEAYDDFLNEVEMLGDFSPSTLNMHDISYFAPEITGMDNEIRLKGIIKGRVSSLKARQFNFEYGNKTKFEGNINMDGLPDIEETFIHLKIKNLVTDYDDIRSILLPDSAHLELPEIIRNVGNINVKGFFTGFYNDFVSSANFQTSIGTMITDLSLKMGKAKVIDYNGHLNLINWDLGETLSDSGNFEKVDFTSTIAGRIEGYKNFEMNVDATIQRIGLYSNEFHNINVDGAINNKQFNGELTLRDSLLNVDFKGVMDFTDSLPKMNFTAELDSAYLSKLKVWDRDTSSCLSTRMDFDFTGNSIDNLLGSLKFMNTSYSENNKKYEVREVALTTNADPGGNKSLNLRSDFADADFNGKFTFADFYNSLSNIIGTYLPSAQMSSWETKKIEKEQLFDYSIDIKNVDPLTELFLPGFSLQSKASLFGSYNSSSETVLINGQADSFEYNGFHFKDWYLRGQNSGRSLQLTTGSSSLNWKEPTKEDPQKLGIDMLSINTYMQGDSVRYDISWKNIDTILKNSGDIQGTLHFAGTPQIKSALNKVDLVINNAAWNISQDGDIIIDSTMIAINNLMINGKGQQLRLKGKLSENPEDVMNLEFENLDLANSAVILRRDDLRFDGIINGKVTLSDFYKAKTIQSDLTIDNFTFNGEKMGDAKLLSWWDNEKSGLGVDAKIIYKGNVGTHNPLIVKGFIYPGEREEGNFDLNINLLNYKLASLNPFIIDFASNLKGMATGELKMAGTFDKPDISGEVQLLRTQMKIDYLNVTYSFADKVIIEPELISANNIVIYDSLGNTGICNFRLSHNYYYDMYMDLSINAKNLAGLSTTLKQNELFYGTAFATGQFTIKGPFDALKMDIKARSEANTNIYIPINLSVDASENEYIRFINKKETAIQPNPFVTSTSGVSLDMLLDVTKDANIQIFLPEDIGNIKGNGEGNISMGIDSQGDITMFGDYIMNEGTFLFTFKNILNRVFSIDKGSKISFNGSPYEADIDLKAVYKVRASLKSIPEIADMPEYAGKTIPVDCIISLKNNLYNPDIAFNIRLPEADQTLKQIVYTSIDTTNEAIMTQQMVSLLVTKSFSFSSGNTSLANTVSSSSIEMLTNQLSNLLSQISKDVDIGLNYRTGTELSSEELEVALSTHLFNDRVTIDGNVGMMTSASAQNVNNIVGDVTIDVKITPDGRFRVKVFNKSYSPFDNNAAYATYKQGVGVYYRYEFDKLSEIFRRPKKKQLTPPLQ